MIRKLLAGAGAGAAVLLCAALPMLLFSETTMATGRLDRKNYSIELVGGNAKQGQTLKVGVKIIAKGEYKVHMHGAPLTIRFTPPEGLKLGKKVLGVKDASKNGKGGPAFLTDAGSSGPGEFQVPVDMEFVLCSAKVCKPVKDRATIKVVFEAAK